MKSRSCESVHSSAWRETNKYAVCQMMVTTEGKAELWRWRDLLKYPAQLYMGWFGKVSLGEWHSSRLQGHWGLSHSDT